MVKLRDYQDLLVEGVRAEYFKGFRSVLMSAPTGAGKTVIFSHIAHNAAQKGKRVVILAHRRELIIQTVRKLNDYDVEPGVIAPGFTWRDSRGIQVASVQTLVRRELGHWEPDLIVVDEAHHATAGTYRKIIDRWPSARLLGVTATPCRSDGAGLGDMFHSLVNQVDTGMLIERGFLSPYRAFAPPIKFDMSHLRVTAGDYNNKDLAGEIDKPSITGDAVEHYRKICPGQPAIAFCVSVDHAIHTAQAFIDAGYRWRHIDGTMPPDVRDGLIKALAKGEIHGLSACDIVSEGTDIPVVTAAILLRPTMSEGLYLQQVGRVLRPIYADGMPIDTDEERLLAIAAGNKAHAIILDHVGNVQRHGMPCDKREWVLEATKPKKSKKDTLNIKHCRQCFEINRSQSRICTNCNTPFIIQSREIEHVEGELQEIKSVQRENYRKTVAKLDSFEALLEVEQARGYKRGWAKHVWAAKEAKRARVAGV